MDDKHKSALSVAGGVPKPEAVHQPAVDQLHRKRKKEFTASELFDGLRSGDRALLSRSITLVESVLPAHQETARELIAMCMPWSGRSFRLGITGVPGAGKSTFIEALGSYVTGQGRQLAVLAIDPSSSRSKGSILGDKTRMEELSSNPAAFIRPSPSGGSLGGVARKTRESVILCEAAGFDTIFIETVGVGQSETAVHSMVDFFLLLMIPGAGDELQGIKRGIMEMADAIIINKADGTNMQKAEQAKAEYRSALHLFPPSPSGWEPRVEGCSALQRTGIAEVWDMIGEYRAKVNGNGWFDRRRSEQAKYWFYETIRDGLQDRFFRQEAVAAEISRLEHEVSAQKISSFAAAGLLLEKFLR
ncbi:MAG: methylmalonyl Co-A mutase-associated GTPase MeaB [Bacteroidota bacterium]